MFAFAHQRLPMTLRFRLWRSALQLCVAYPTLAPLAEIPVALLAAAEDAPPGAAELVAAALALGADETTALGALPSRLARSGAQSEAEELLMPGRPRWPWRGSAARPWRSSASET